MKRLLTATAITLIAAALPAQDQGASASDPGGQGDKGWRLVWSDDFEGPEIDPAKWNHQVFPGVASGNNELQHYTDRPVNSFVEDGRLVIKAIREEYRDHAYTSARLNTAGKFAFRYGRVEARIKIPSTPGIWPAFWMMPEESVYGGWPHSGEIDIMESVNDADEIYGTIHYGNPGHTHQGEGVKLAEVDGRRPLFSEDFHVYAAEWQPGEIRWYLDGELFGVQTEWASPHAPFPAPFDQEFHLLLNVAVGGNWPGSPDDSSVFPQTMEVDWVRVYQSGNEFPTVEVLAPAQGAIVPANEPMRIEIEANDPDGEIVRAQLLRGLEVLAEASEAPFALLAPGLADGCYDDLTVLVIDDQGARARANLAIEAGRGCPQEPWGDSAIALPGHFEAEHFDRGRPGEAYHDSDKSNQGRAFRGDSQVDVGEDDGVRYLGWTEAGEWVEYTVTVPEAGTYRFSGRVASAAGGGTIQISADGTSQTVHANAPGTGDWHTFDKIGFAGLITLSEGLNVLRLTWETGGVNVDSLEGLLEGDKRLR
ncbi:MAG: family 16 glycosylhydrolase [Sumerlaeia bacterium]